MQKQQVIQAIEDTPKGANIVVEWLRPLTPLKTSGCTDEITKSCRMVGRIGVNYDNKASVQQKRESGELPAVNAGLNGMEWERPPYLLRSLRTGRSLLRLTTGTSDKVKPEVHFFRNGVEVERETLNGIVASKDWKPSDKGECFSCHIDDMTRINQESEWVMIVAGHVGQEVILTAEHVEAKQIAKM